MAIRNTIRSLMKPTSKSGETRVIDLGGQASHRFEFNAHPSLVFEYFADVPAVFKLLPDVMQVEPFGTDSYRIVVGANDHLGHTMAGVFDLQVEFDDKTIRIFPVQNGPAVRIKGITFPGDMWLEVEFAYDGQMTIADYNLELSLTIPLPGPMLKMPRQAVQKMGEKAMSYKISHMVTGFARHVKADFARFAYWSMAADGSL